VPYGRIFKSETLRRGPKLEAQQSLRRSGSVLRALLVIKEETEGASKERLETVVGEGVTLEALGVCSGGSLYRKKDDERSQIFFTPQKSGDLVQGREGVK